jgi:lysophospholipase L1-like esterase
MNADLIRRLGKAAAAAVLSLSIFTVPVFSADATKTAEPPKKAAAPAAPAAKEAADVGAIKKGRDDGKSFLARHEGFLKDLKAKEGKVDLLLVGDSITDGWRGGGKDVLQKQWGSKMSVLNIGIGGDRTQHVIWRLDNGEVEGIKPKVAMLMIGTNNLGGNTNEEIVAGVTKIVKQLNEKLPTTKVLLLGIFPRGEKADNPFRARIKAINEEIAKLDDGGKHVKYLDIGKKFLQDDGTLPKDIMPDALHPNAKGYQIWADAVQPTLDELMK